MSGSRGLATGLVLGGVVSVQVGAAFATTLFDELGPGGAVFLRIGFAALLLLAIWRPGRTPSHRGTRGFASTHVSRTSWWMGRRDVVWLGVALAAMNASFYLALDRIPLGIAVTLEFVGPLGVAIWRSRRRRDLLWVTLAAAGLLLLSPVPGSSLDALGVVAALVAGGFWGAYILLTARVGRALPGGGGLAVAMLVAALLTAPLGLADGGSALLDADLLAVGLLVAVLSSVIPYSLELEALRRLPERTFGVLMSLEPAVAAIVGFVGLDQGLASREVIAIGLVLVASAGALQEAEAPPPTEA